MGLVKGLGCKLQYFNGSAFQDLAQLTETSGTQIELGIADVTTLDDSWKRKRGTIPDGGDVSGSGLFDPALSTHQFLFDSIADPPDDPTQWRILYSNGWYEQFDGILNEFKKNNINPDNYVGFDFNIAVDGPVEIDEVA